MPAALFVANGYGKLLGVTQLRELGELETPILLTCTLCVWKAADALDWVRRRNDPTIGALGGERFEQMRADEVTHGEMARRAGGVDLPGPVRFVMHLASRVMTGTARWL